MNKGPLAGVRILDLSQEGPGKFCTMLLSDLGAEVIVVDRPERQGHADAEGPHDPLAEGLPRPHFDALLRNKQRIGLNLKRDAGKEVLKRLVADADAVIVQMRPGKPDALGIGYEDLKALNNKIIYCEITGYGVTNGPLRDRAGHDLNYLGTSGALSLLAGWNHPPSRVPYVLADFGGAGMMAAVSILAALEARHRTGEGQHIDLAMNDSTMYLIAEWISSTFDPEAISMGAMADYPPYDAYECADGRFLALGCIEPHFWENVCTIIERPDLVQLAGESDRRDYLRNELKQVFATKSRSNWLTLFEPHDVPVTTVLEIDELPEDTQLRERSMVVTVPSEHGPVQQVGIPAKFSATPGAIRSVGVPNGANTGNVLADAGFSPEQIEQLRAAGAVFG